MPVRQRVGRSVENIAAVQSSVVNDPNQSIPRLCQELGIVHTTLWRILEDIDLDDTFIHVSTLFFFSLPKKNCNRPFDLGHFVKRGAIAFS